MLNFMLKLCGEVACPPRSFWEALIKFIPLQQLHYQAQMWHKFRTFGASPAQGLQSQLPRSPRVRYLHDTNLNTLSTQPPRGQESLGHITKAKKRVKIRIMAVSFFVLNWGLGNFNSLFIKQVFKPLMLSLTSPPMELPISAI